MSTCKQRGWTEGSLKSRSSRVYRVTNVFSAKQTNPYMHSARFQATEIRISTKTRLVRDSSEVSATSGGRETVGGSYSTRSSVALRRKGLRPLYVSVGVTYR